MYLREFSLGNFKAFGPTQTLPIKPITLIFGPNSGGKSSLIHGLLLARHAALKGTTDLNVHRIDIDGEHVDLGGFRQFIFTQDLSKYLDFGFGLAASHWFPKSGSGVGMRMSIGVPQSISKTGEEEPLWPPILASLQVVHDGQVIMDFGGSPDGGSLVLGSVNTSLFVGLAKLQAKKQKMKKVPSDAALQRALDAFVAGYDYSDPEFLPRTLSENTPHYPERDNVQPDPYLDVSAPAQGAADLQKAGELLGALGQSQTPASEGAQSDPFDAEEIRQALQQRFSAARTLMEAVFEWLSGVVDSYSEAIRRDMRSLHYYGPLRAYPPRRIMGSTVYDAAGLPGSIEAWEKVRCNEGLREQVNRWLSSDFLSTRYRFEVRKLYDHADIVKRHQRPVMAKTTERLLSKLEGGVEPRDQELILVDGRTGARVSHRDIGIGVSQVLPILVAALGPTGEIAAIEQPEIHLHPALQAELGDLFIESALVRKNTFLLETHSEHLILRILRRIRETTAGKLREGLVPIHPADLSVVYVEPTDGGAKIARLEVDEEGEFVTPWPGGFFEEGFKERFGG